VTLTDAGPLIALLNQKDEHHHACMVALSTLPSRPMLTTWPCFTEAMYLLGEAGGYLAQRALWHLRAGGRLVLHDLSEAEVERASVLMATYRDAPMDLGDASLVAVAESLSLRRVFTLDRHFYIYRLANGSAFDVLPHP